MIRIDEYRTANTSYRVMAADTDMYYRATVPCYFSFMQEIAASHAASCGVAVSDLIKEGFTWVITRTSVTFFGNAFWGDDVEIKSWPQEPKGLHCPRVITGSVKGSKVFEAMTLWAILDLNRKRPSKPNPVLDKMGLPDPDKYYVNPNLPNMPRWDDTEKLRILPDSVSVPTYYDIDSNKHINNTVYIEKCMAALDYDFLRTHMPVHMDVKWVKQTFSGEEMRTESAVTSETDNETSFIQRVLNSEGETVFESVSDWKKSNQ